MLGSFCPSLLIREEYQCSSMPGEFRLAREPNSGLPCGFQPSKCWGYLYTATAGSNSFGNFDHRPKELDLPKSPWLQGIYWHQLSTKLYHRAEKQNQTKQTKTPPILDLSKTVKRKKRKKGLGFWALCSRLPRYLLKTGERELALWPSGYGSQIPRG